jgi:hypothetical protein
VRVSVKHRLGDRSECCVIGGRVQAFSLLVDFLSIEPNSQIALLEELIHEVAGVAGTVLASNYDVLLTADRPRFAGSFDLLDQIIDPSTVIFTVKALRI